MPPDPAPTLQRALRLPITCLALAASLVWPAARAGTVSALAAQNLVGQDQDSSTNGAEVFARFGQASARAARTLVHATADGQGAGPQTAFQSSAGSTSVYTLWDVGRNLPLAAVDALQMELDFNFELVGSLSVGPTSLSVASTRYVGGLDMVGGAGNFSGTLSVSYGPIPGGFGFTPAGDGGLFGSYARSFTARHAQALGGGITMVVANTAANNAQAQSTMALVSIGLIGGALPPGGLGVRIDETGLVLAVTPAVPEPGSALLALAGLCGLLGWRRHTARQTARH